MDKKKITERYQLNKFLSNPELNLRVVSIIENETPDFIVNASDRKISIELTRLINPNLKEIEVYRDKIVKNAEKIFLEKYSEDLYVLVNCENIKLNRGKEIERKYAFDLFNIIEKLYLANMNFEFDITLKDGKTLNHFINRLQITNRLGFSNWQHFGAHVVGKIDINWLSEKIITKEKNIKKYKELFDENWLLLISNFGTKSSAHRYDYLDFKEINTEFDKVFVYKYMQNETIVIK